MKKSALYLTLTVLGAFLFATIGFGDSVKSTTQGTVYGWQTWGASNINNNGYPHWDNLSWDGTYCNMGYLLTNSAACTAGGASSIGSPGAIPFWGASYNSSGDTGGQADPNFFFRKDVLSNVGNIMKAHITAYQGGGNPLDEFGWYDASTPAYIHSSYPFMSAATPVGTVGSLNSCFSSYGFHLKTVGNFSGSQIPIVYRTEASKNQRLDNMTFFDTSDQHFAVFHQTSPDVYWVGVEDLRFFNTDRDYNDILIRLQSTLVSIQNTYSFTSPSVTTARLSDQDTAYISSFNPNSTQFWQGSLAAYQLNSDGTLPLKADNTPLNPPLWDAGQMLTSKNPDTRNIYTAVGSPLSQKQFTPTYVSNNDLYGTGGSSYGRSITVNSGQVSGTLSNFPMLVSIQNDTLMKTVANGGHVLDTNGTCTTPQQGCDIYFTDSIGNVLPSQIEKYDGTNGTLVAWVGVPSITNGTIIYMWYGNNVQTYNPTGVWSLDGNYKAVWHLNEATGSTSMDSTSNGNNGTPVNSPTQTTGKIGNGLSFNGSNSEDRVSSTFGLGTTNVTMEAWVYLSSTSMRGAFIKIGGTSPNQGYAMGVGGSLFENLGNNFLLLYEGVVWMSTGKIFGTGWHHAVMAIDPSGHAIAYLDGVQVYTNPSYLPLAPQQSITYIGGYTGSLSEQRHFNGTLDEVRVSNTVRSAGWIQAEYNNQNSPGTFYTLGSETPLCGSQCQNLISYVRGQSDPYGIKPVAQNNNLLKFGDIFHSNAVIVGEPSRFFQDECFDKCSNGSQSFYQANQNRTKVAIVGANDGMLHAFNASTGDEAWAFIPNSILSNLKSMTWTHTYYVDSTPKVANVWFDYNGDNKKTTNEWRTVLVSGLKKGGKTYFALDITDTSNPQYLWEFPKSSDPLYTASLPYLGQSWSEPAIGRVEVGGKEKWVAFIGGGFDATNMFAQNAGMAFFVVDMQYGTIIKQFSGLSGMTYPLTAPPTAADTNSDGYIDKVYIGDLGGQMWVFDLSDPNNVNNWTGRRLFTAPVSLVSPYEKHPIYYPPTVALDNNLKPWVYFGTGDIENATDPSNPNERFYAVQDDGIGNYPRTETDLKNVTSVNTFTQDGTKKGWFIQLYKDSQTREKVFSKPVVFNKLVYFTTTTYNPATDVCSVAGQANLYTVEWLSGGGAVSTLGNNLLPANPSNRSVTIGSNSGVPSSPVISVDLKGNASVNISTSGGPGGPSFYSSKVLSPTKKVIYWREVIPK